MGYSVTEQGTWGAAALIVVGPAADDHVTRGSAVPDPSAGGRMHPGLFYGAIDSRRPAGAAIGE